MKSAQDYARVMVEDGLSENEPLLAMVVTVSPTDCSLAYSFGIASTAPVPFEVQHAVLQRFGEQLRRLQADGAEMGPCTDGLSLRSKGGN